MRVKKDKMLEFIRKNESVTFEDMERFFESRNYAYKGDTGIILGKSRLVVWHGWNRKTSRAFMELVSAGKVGIYRINMSKAPIPPVFKSVSTLQGMEYVPVIIKSIGK